MALDVLIGILLFVSAIVNILALGAFWITPSLRTTSNRFVINLLVANLASCIILAPSFLLNATSGDSDDKDSGNNAITLNNNNLVLKSTEINETIKCFTNNNNNSSNNNNNNNKISNDCISNINNIKIVKNYSSDNSDDDVISKHFTEIKCWGLDLAAALGSLSVLLVVGDTWCAVTDPLRYHTRISSLKAWILIVSMWIISAVFGFGSAFRNRKLMMTDYVRDEVIEDIQSDHNEIINKTIRDTFVLDEFSITENLYTTIYSYLFFIIIILLPFIVVCAMYWRIFSEARGNGLRMRQNGSSPLLQSALNLAATQHNNNNNNNTTSNNNNSNSNEKQPQQQQTPTHYTGLTLKIDNNSNCVEKPPIRLDLTKATERNPNNILLTVTTDTPTLMTSANSIEYMRRNHSARQLFLLESTNNIKNCGENIRHVHSTPNLQKLMFSDSLHHHNHLHHANGFGNHSNGHTLSANLQVPPKALSYMTSIRHRLSNASSLFKYREESRAARISILVVIMFLVSYLPYGILILIQGHVNFITSYQSAIIAILTVLLANLSSPFIFAYRNKRVCRGVKHLLGLEKKSSQNTNLFRGRNNTYKTTVSKVKRSCSKASTYSQASNRYLTPQSALKGTFVLEIEKCTDDEDSSYEEKKSFLKRICDTSRKWDCTTDSCSGKINDNEQTEV